MTDILRDDMNTKLTLTIDSSIIKKAKKYAADNGRSLSDLVEGYLHIITKEGEGNERPLTPIGKSLKGAFKAPKDFDYKKELSDSLSKKYL